jgi:hypothetical protein
MAKRYEYKYVRVKLKGGGFTGNFNESTRIKSILSL